MASIVPQLSVDLNKMDLLDILFPQYCLACREKGKYLCPNCMKKVGKGSIQRESYSLWRYEGVIKKAILTLKYRFISDLSDELSYLASNQIELDFPKLGGVLIPIPLTKKRANWRGFNQTNELGRRIAKQRVWGYEPNLLIKPRDTFIQAHLDKNARKENIKDAFSLSYKEVPKNIILFDDIRTTGATLNEAKNVLLKGGANKIICLTIASS